MRNVNATKKCEKHNVNSSSYYWCFIQVLECNYKNNLFLLMEYFANVFEIQIALFLTCVFLVFNVPVT